MAVNPGEDSPLSSPTGVDGGSEESAGESGKPLNPPQKCGTQISNHAQGSEDGGFEDSDVDDLTLEEFEDIDFDELLQEQEPQEGDMPFLDWPGAPKKGDGDLRELKKRWDAEGGINRKSVFDEDD